MYAVITPHNLVVGFVDSVIEFTDKYFIANADYRIVEISNQQEVKELLTIKPILKGDIFYYDCAFKTITVNVTRFLHVISITNDELQAIRNYVKNAPFLKRLKYLFTRRI
jgi:hypothetical protein